MEVRITTRHGNISANEENWIRTKLDRLSRFFREDHPARVVVVHAEDRSTVELSVEAPRGVNLSAHAEATDLRTAVRAAESRLEAQLRKLKDRIMSRRNSARGMLAGE